MAQIPTPIPLEDAWYDVLSKAIRGTGIDEKNLAPSANIIPSQLKSILGGEKPSDDTLRRLAIGVGLSPKPFLDLAHGRYRPKPFDSTRWSGVAQVSSYYMDVIVNAYLIWDPQSKVAILFDTGTEFSSLEKVLQQQQLKLHSIAITHTHGDHIAILDEILGKYHPNLYSPQHENLPGSQPVGEGDTFQIGPLRCRTLLTPGHSAGHVTYVVEGNPHWTAPVAIVGDTLFAGSMGRGGVSYARLRENIQTKILTLPAETLICPGHGPMTTVSEEVQHNPFA
jgi:glyoxylase-like metal-dependent hydrolase (beta-lactamase superfamily II)